MLWLFLTSSLYGVWVFHHADVSNPQDVGLMLVYYTFMTMSCLYFLLSLFRYKPGAYPLRYRINNICLLGVAIAISVPTIIKLTAAVLVSLFFLI